VREMLALLRASWLSAWSYRLQRLFSLIALVLTVVPVYFISTALQPVMAESITTQGGEYFAFLVVGLAVYSLLSVPVSGLEAAIGSGIRTGTLEAMLSTRTPLHTILGGMLLYNLLWSASRGILMLVAAAALGATFALDGLLPALVIIAIIVAAYLPFGILAAAMFLAFRTSGPLVKAVLAASALLGGVYYPTNVIPSWIQTLSEWVPLTYGLRAVRQTLLEGFPVRAVLPDVGVLLAFSVVLFAISGLAFGRAFEYARRTGTLAQY
jgi:ABC-2 type transport system permease protein